MQKAIGCPLLLALLASAPAAAQTALTNIDLPGVNATVTLPFRVVGWAIDLAALTGTGVSAVHSVGVLSRRPGSVSGCRHVWRAPAGRGRRLRGTVRPLWIRFIGGHAVGPGNVHHPGLRAQ